MYFIPRLTACLESDGVILQWKPDIQEEYRIELAISWNDDDDIFVAILLTQQNAFTLQVLSIPNQDEYNTAR